MCHIKSIFEDGGVFGVSLQRRLNGERENGENTRPRPSDTPSNLEGERAREVFDILKYRLQNNLKRIGCFGLSEPRCGDCSAEALEFSAEDAVPTDGFSVFVL